MKSYYLMFATSFLVLISCQNKQKQNLQSKTDTSSGIEPMQVVARNQRLGSYLIESGDSLLVDPFEMEVSLSEKAKELILNSNETIVISFYYYGYPKDKKYANSETDGTLYLVGGKKEITYGQIARFENVKISKKDYEHLIDKDFEVNVNIYSGRKSSQNNLLNCEPLFDKISNVANKRFTSNCKLIYGDE